MCSLFPIHVTSTPLGTGDTVLTKIARKIPALLSPAFHWGKTNNEHAKKQNPQHFKVMD